MRVIAESLVALVFTVLLTIVGVALFQASGGGDPGAAIDSAWRLTATGAAIAFTLWAVMLVIGNIATRRRGWAAHVVLGFGTAVLAALVNAGVVILIALVAPSDDSWVYAIAAIATLVSFLIAALVSLLLTHIVVVRRRPAEPETTSEIAPVEASA
jgi:hypothetical protein